MSRHTSCRAACKIQGRGQIELPKILGGGGGGNTIQECIGVQRLGGVGVGWVGWTYYIVGNNAMYNSRGLRDW